METTQKEQGSVTNPSVHTQQPQDDTEDTFRQNSRELTQDEQDAITAIKVDAQSLLDGITVNIKDGNVPEMMLAKRKLQECVFWAVSGITK